MLYVHPQFHLQFHQEFHVTIFYFYCRPGDVSGSRWPRPPRHDPHEMFYHYYEHQCLDQCHIGCRIGNSHGHGHGSWRQKGKNFIPGINDDDQIQIQVHNSNQIQIQNSAEDYHFYDDQSAEHFNSYDGRQRKNRDGRILDIVGGVVGGGLNVAGNLAGSAAAVAGALAAGGGRITAEFVKILLDTIANLVPLPAINLQLPMPEPRTKARGRNNRGLFFFKGTVIVLVTIKGVALIILLIAVPIVVPILKLLLTTAGTKALLLISKIIINFLFPIFMPHAATCIPKLGGGCHSWDPKTFDADFNKAQVKTIIGQLETNFMPK